MSKEAWIKRKEEQKAILSQIDELHDKLEAAKQATDAAALEYCWEAKLLSKVVWRLRGADDPSLVADLNDPATSQIASLFQTGWHSQSALSLNAKIHFDDGELSLVFSSFAELITFAKEKELTLDTKHIRDLVESHHQQKNNHEQKAREAGNFLLSLASSGAKVV